MQREPGYSCNKLLLELSSRHGTLAGRRLLLRQNTTH